MLPTKKILPSSPNLEGNEKKYLLDVLESKWLARGKYITKFEEEFAKFTQTKYCLTVSNGSVAIELALLALDIKEGDEVLCPNLTYAATASAIVHIKAKPILIDIKEGTWNIDPKKIKEKITPKTKAIILVHLFGEPCEMDEILTIAKEHNLKVIEDCAQAHGATYKDRVVGSFGDVSCFSFFGNKIMIMGEGGACVTNNPQTYEKMKLLRNQGESKLYWHEVAGYNYRLTEMQAAVGLAQLERVQEFIAQKQKQSDFYKTLLKNESITFQEEIPNAKKVHWMFPITLKNANRDEIIKKLAEKNVDVRHFFYPLNIMPPYKDDATYPISKEVAEQGIYLPNGLDLDEEKIKYIANALLEELK